MDIKKRIVFITGLIGIIAIISLLFSKGFNSDNILSAIIEVVGIILAIGIFDAISTPKSLKKATQNAMQKLVENFPDLIKLENVNISTLNPKAPLFKIEPLYNGILEIHLSYKVLSAFNYSNIPKTNIDDEKKRLIYKNVSENIFKKTESYLNEHYGKKMFAGETPQRNGKNYIIKFKFKKDYFKPKDYEELLIATCSELINTFNDLNNK